MALVPVIRDKVPKLLMVARTCDNLWFDDWYILAHREKKNMYNMKLKRDADSLEGVYVGSSSYSSCVCR